MKPKHGRLGDRTTGQRCQSGLAQIDVPLAICLRIWTPGLLNIMLRALCQLRLPSPG